MSSFGYLRWGDGGVGLLPLNEVKWLMRESTLLLVELRRFWQVIPLGPSSDPLLICWPA